eukprot:gene29752-36847_t
MAETLLRVFDSFDIAQRARSALIAAIDQSIATNSMAKAEAQFVLLNEQLGKLAALEKRLSEQAHDRARADFQALGVTMAGLVLLSIALSLLATIRVRAALLRDIHAIGDAVRELAAGRLALGKRNEQAQNLAHAVSIFKLSSDAMHKMAQPAPRAAPAKPAPKPAAPRTAVVATASPKAPPKKLASAAPGDDWEEF